MVNGQEIGLQVRSLDNSDGVHIEHAWSVSKLPITLRGLPNNRDISAWPHLSGIQIPEISSEEVLLLIGSDTPEAFWSLEERRGSRGEPYATRSILGWTVQGPMGQHVDSHVAQVNFQQSSGDILQDQINNMWNNEFNECPSSTKPLSVEDKRALKMMKASVKKDNNHYMVGLPWRENSTTFPNNRPMASIRLKYLEKKLKNDKQLHTRYKKQIDEYIAKDYASKISPSVDGPRV